MNRFASDKDNVEIDLILERPGLPLALIEIKATSRIIDQDLSSFSRISKEFKKAEVFCFSRDPAAKVIGGIRCLPWQKGLEKLFKS